MGGKKYSVGTSAFRQGNMGRTRERGPLWLAATRGEWTVEMWVIGIPAGTGTHE